jgi:hypothetical protein
MKNITPQMHSPAVRDPGNPDPDIGWVSATTARIAGGRPQPPPSVPTLWSGTITMPESIGSGKYRIVVKEFESYYDDYTSPTNSATRLVYADTIDV